MSSPRHLWSGDWERDSTAAAEELARRRAQTEEPDGTPPEVPPVRAPSPRARVRPAVSRIGSFEFRAALVVAALVLLTAGVAFGATMLLNASDGQGSTAPGRVHSWLGVDVAGSPYGIVVTNVVAGSPAQSAGLEPGDLISQINGQPVDTVDGVSAALGGLHPGDTIQIGFTRGIATFTTAATLAGGGP